MSDTKKIIRDVLSSIASEHNYKEYQLKLKEISTDGANYSSKLYEACISAPDKANLELFGKVGIIGEEVRAILKLPIYDKELFFYNNLVNRYKAIKEKYKIPENHRLRIPKFYGCNKSYLQETLVMENLSKNDFKCENRFKSVEWEYAAESIKQLAIFHALSVVLGKESPVTHGKILKDLEYVFPKSFFEKMVGNSIDASKDEYRERFSIFLESNLQTETFEMFFKPVRLAVIAHGDFRPSNLMHRRLENGQLEVAIVDFQTLHTGNPITDLLYYIFNGSDKKFRREHYRQLLEHYYTELCSALRRFNLSPDLIYTKQDFECDLKEILPYGLVVVTFTLPLVTIDAENAPKLEGDFSKNYNEAKTSPLFAERLNEIISDYIEMGLL